MIAQEAVILRGRGVFSTQARLAEPAHVPMGWELVADPGADEALDPGHAAPNHEGSPEAQPKAGGACIPPPPLRRIRMMLRAHTHNPRPGVSSSLVMSGYIHCVAGRKKEVGDCVPVRLSHLPDPVQGAILTETDRCCHVSGDRRTDAIHHVCG